MTGGSGDCGQSAEIAGSPRLPPAPRSSSSSCPGPPRPLQNRRAQLWPQAGLAVCPSGPWGGGRASGPSTEVTGGSSSSQMCAVWLPARPQTPQKPPTGGLRAGGAPGKSGPHVPFGGSSHPTHPARRGPGPAETPPGHACRVHGPPRTHTSLSPGDPREGGVLHGVSPRVGTGGEREETLGVPGLRQHQRSRIPLPSVCSPLSSSPRGGISGVSLLALKDTHALLLCSLQPAGAPGGAHAGMGVKNPGRPGRQTWLPAEETCPLKSNWQASSSVLHRCCSIYRVTVCGDPEPSKSVGAILQQRLLTLCLYVTFR